MERRGRRSLQSKTRAVVVLGTDFPGIFYLDIRAAGVVSPYKCLQSALPKFVFMKESLYLNSQQIRQFLRLCVGVDDSATHKNQQNLTGCRGRQPLRPKTASIAVFYKCGETKKSHVFTQVIVFRQCRRQGNVGNADPSKTWSPHSLGALRDFPCFFTSPPRFIVHRTRFGGSPPAFL